MFISKNQRIHFLLVVPMWLIYVTGLIAKLTGFSKIGNIIAIISLTRMVHPEPGLSADTHQNPDKKTAQRIRWAQPEAESHKSR